MLQLHLSNRQFYCLLDTSYIRDFTVVLLECSCFSNIHEALWTVFFQALSTLPWWKVLISRPCLLYHDGRFSFPAPAYSTTMEGSNFQPLPTIMMEVSYFYLFLLYHNGRLSFPGPVYTTMIGDSYFQTLPTLPWWKVLISGFSHSTVMESSYPRPCLLYHDGSFLFLAFPTLP